MNNFNTHYIRTMETEFGADSVLGFYDFDLSDYGPQNNTIEYFYFVDGNGDLVEPTGNGRVSISISTGSEIFYELENGNFDSTLASSPLRKRSTFKGKSTKLRVSFSEEIEGAVGFKGLCTQNAGSPASQEVHAKNGLDVFLINGHSQTVILPMVRQVTANSLASDTVINSYTITVSDATGFIAGQHIRIINSEADRYYNGTILTVNINTITLDNQIDFTYLAGSEVTVSDVNMAVDGSITPVIFTLRTGSPSIPSVVDITRCIITCVAESPVDLDLFGDLPKLTRGLAFRSINGIQFNIFNVKTNKDLANISYDFTPYTAVNPAQGIDGFATRLTFAGQEKIGVALRTEKDDNLQMIVQDDLTGLVELTVMLEGHALRDL